MAIGDLPVIRAGRLFGCRRELLAAEVHQAFHASIVAHSVMEAGRVAPSRWAVELQSGITRRKFAVSFTLTRGFARVDLCASSLSALMGTDPLWLAKTDPLGAPVFVPRRSSPHGWTGRHEPL